MNLSSADRLRPIGPIFPALFFFVGVILLSGCRYTADFVLVNKTEKVLTVRYWLKETEALRLVTVKGRLATLRQHELNYREFNAFPEERIKIARDLMSATVQLLPQEVLFLTELDIRDISDEPTLKSGICKITIESDAGAILYEGDQVFLHFLPGQDNFWPGSPTLYTLTVTE